MNGRIIYANVIARLHTLRREKFAIFFTFAFPVLLILVFGMIFATPATFPVQLHIQDRDTSARSAHLIEHLSTSSMISVKTIPPERDPAAHAREYDRALVLVIPEGFAQSHASDPGASPEHVELTYLYEPDALRLGDDDRFLSAILADVNHRTMVAIAAAYPETTERDGLGMRFLDFFVPGIIAMSIMTASLYGSLHVHTELRQQGVLRKLAATPMTQTEWLISNVLYQFIIAAGSTTIILLVSYLAFGVVLHLNLWLGVYVLLTVAMFVGLGMIVAPLVPDAESASASGNAILFPMMFLAGTFFPIALMPGPLQGIAYILPLYYINEGLRAALLLTDHGAATGYALIAGVFAMVLFAMGLLASRWNEPI